MPPGGQGRIVPVSERVKWTLCQVLAGMTRQNGYAYTLRQVRRAPGDAFEGTDVPMAWVSFGVFDATERMGTGDRIDEQTTMTVRAVASCLGVDQADREGNLLAAELQRILQTTNAPFVDPFYQFGQIWTWPQQIVFGYPSPDSAVVVVVGTWIVRWWRLATDPRLWDDGDHHIYESQIPLGG